MEVVVCPLGSAVVAGVDLELAGSKVSVDRHFEPPHAWALIDRR